MFSPNVNFFGSADKRNQKNTYLYIVKIGLNISFPTKGIDDRILTNFATKIYTPEILATLHNDLKDRGKEGTHLVFNLSA